MLDGFDKSLFDDVQWDATGAEIEKESFRRIEEETGELRERFDEREWRVARRLIHTTADLSIAGSLVVTLIANSGWSISPVTGTSSQVQRPCRRSLWLLPVFGMYP